MEISRKEHFKELITQMSRGAYEREEVIALSLLSAIAGESIFLLGLPGVGKSMVARRLKDAFKDSRCFEYLMSRFSTPDEIFGPVSISKLKDEVTYERNIDGYLPTADVAFLHEIWKAGPAIQNSLLTALNEKIFHNGQIDIDLPLKGIIAASNELPAEDEGLEALWDRFLIRYIVQPIAEKDAFYALLNGSGDGYDGIHPKIQITQEWYSHLNREMNKVNVPEYIMNLLYNLRQHYIDERLRKAKEEDDDGIDVPYISDRRWKKIVGILKASAYLNGREKVDFSDCLLLEHMLWDKDTQIRTVMKDVSESVASGFLKYFSTITASEESSVYETTEGGVYYIIQAGTEHLLIDRESYDALDEKPVKGRFEYGNRLSVSKEGDFTIKVDKPGTITINNFIYLLKTRTAIRSDKSKSLADMALEMDRMISENIFLRESINDYPILKGMNNRFRGYKR